MKRFKLPLGLAVGVLVLAAAALFAIRPLAEWRLEQRLSKRVGTIRSLSISGSPIALLRGRADRVSVELGTAELQGGAGAGMGEIGRIGELDLRADALDAKGARFDRVHITKRGDALRGVAEFPAQSITFAGNTLQVTPTAEDGELVLTLDGGRRLRVFAQDGNLNVGLAGDGLFGGLSQPVPVDGLWIDGLRAGENGRVDLQATVL